MMLVRKWLSSEEEWVWRSGKKCCGTSQKTLRSDRGPLSIEVPEPIVRWRRERRFDRVEPDAADLGVVKREGFCCRA